MNKRDREALHAVYEALGCPFPSSGSSSTSVAGLSAYANDMRTLVPLMRSVISVACGGELYEGHLQEAIDELKSGMSDTFKGK